MFFLDFFDTQTQPEMLSTFQETPVPACSTQSQPNGVYFIAYCPLS